MYDELLLRRIACIVGDGVPTVACGGSFYLGSGRVGNGKRARAGTESVERRGGAVLEDSCRTQYQLRTVSRSEYGDTH